MLLNAIDFETTGTDTANDRIIEIGSVLWDTETSKPVHIISEFVQLPTGNTVPSEITELTGIRQSDLVQFGLPIEMALFRLSTHIKAADYVVAHNNSFEREILAAEVARLPHVAAWFVMPTKWLDTQYDLDYSPAKSQVLKYMAAEHGFILHYAHRAVFDALASVQIASQHDLARAIAMAEQPFVLLQASIPYAERFVHNEALKRRRFFWHKETHSWYKKVKLCQVDLEREYLKGVNVVVADDPGKVR